jgi:hypothetical protein
MKDIDRWYLYVGLLCKTCGNKHEPDDMGPATINVMIECKSCKNATLYLKEDYIETFHKLQATNQSDKGSITTKESETQNMGNKIIPLSPNISHEYSMAAKWETFENKVLNGVDIHSVQYRMMKEAFYVGALEGISNIQKAYATYNDTIVGGILSSNMIEIGNMLTAINIMAKRSKLQETTDEEQT